MALKRALSLRRSHVARLAVAALVVAMVATLAVVQRAPSPADADDCTRRLVAGGDGVTAGIDASDPASDQYPQRIVEDHADPAPAPGPWCLFNTANETVTTDDYQDEGPPTQQGQAWDRRPHLITLTLGRDNTGIVEHVTTCLQQIKDHNFHLANACALAVLANQFAFDALNNDLADILNQYRVQMTGNPHLVVAVTGYFNPYPSAIDVATKIPGFCAETVDTIPTCIARWILLPPALVTLDQVVQRLNRTLENVVSEFAEATQGRFVFVNPYEKFKDHCTEIDVRIDVTVYHPPNTVDMHTAEEDFGCSNSWIASDGEPGTLSPFPYLTPAVNGVLLVATQTTRNMGIYPNRDGHECIADLVWEAVKHKLEIPEPAEEACS